MDIGASLISLLMILALVVVIFLACREIVCWYWKINESLGKQDELIKAVKDMAAQNAAFHKAILRRLNPGGDDETEEEQIPEVEDAGYTEWGDWRVDPRVPAKEGCIERLRRSSCEGCSALKTPKQVKQPTYLCLKYKKSVAESTFEAA